MRRAVLLVVLACLALPGPAGATGSTPWRAAGEVRDALFDAQTELIVGTRATAEKQVARGSEAYRGPLRAGIRSADPAADKAVLGRAGRGTRGRRARRLRRRSRGARGAARAAMLRGSYAATLAAVDRGEAADARGWLLLREFRTATRFTRPGADATIAVNRLGAGRLDPKRAHAAVAEGPPRRLPGTAARAARRRAARRRERPSGAPRGGGRAGPGLLRDPRRPLHRGPRRFGHAGRPRRLRRAHPHRGGQGRRRVLRRARPRRVGARGLHRGAVHARGGRPPRPAAPALPGARARRVRPRREGHDA